MSRNLGGFNRVAIDRSDEFGRIEELLLSGSETDLNVDGSSTNHVYEFIPSGSSDIELTSLTLMFEASGNVNFGDNILDSGSMDVGLQVEIKTQDVTDEIMNIKRTRDLVRFGIGVFELVSAPTSMVLSRWDFPAGILLKKSGSYATDDYVRVTVRDDMTNLVHGEAFTIGVVRE